MLTEQKIRTFVGEQNFLKGQQGVRDGAIVNPEQQVRSLPGRFCSKTEAPVSEM